MPIEVDSIAPDFTLPDQSGKSRSLRDYRGQVVVLYFYPEDDTPLCTTQACQFRDRFPDFRELNATVIGISPQGVASKRSFADKFDLPITLLADDKPSPDKPRVSTRYGAWGEKNSYGKTIIGMARTTYLIGPDGRVIRRWDRVKTPRHGDAVLAAVQNLKGEPPKKSGRKTRRSVPR
jgi:thioredoxin-dependent peroxiredoxin